ncbi:MAG: hypothetical protein H7A09_10605 [Oceanospirillaceae bacterium]|nr:hypothetical protein [Oceanospirillaceae bacterium]
MADLPHIRIKLLLEWLRLGWWLGAKIRTLQAWQLTELTTLLDFVFEKPVITTRIIKGFKIKRKWHEGPAEELLGLTVGQWRIVEPFVAEFQRTKRKQLLNYIMGMLYICPADKAGKTWQQYIIGLDGLAKKWEVVPEHQKLAALMQYMGMREVLIKGNPELLPKPDARMTAGAPPPDWSNIVLQMAGTASDVDRIDDMTVWVFLKYLKAKKSHEKPH